MRLYLSTIRIGYQDQQNEDDKRDLIPQRAIAEIFPHTKSITGHIDYTLSEDEFQELVAFSDRLTENALRQFKEAANVENL